jgi:hypothetical protein
MISGLTMVWGGMNITSLLNQWANNGVFSYVLPFLLVFAFVYGLLSKVNILGTNKGVNMIIALAVGGLSLVGDYVPRFFQSIFPSLGMGIAVLISAVILLGLFLGDTDLKWIKYVIFGIGVIAFLVVIFSALADYTFIGNTFWQDQGGNLILIALIIVALVLIVTGGPKGDKAGKSE